MNVWLSVSGYVKHFVLWKFAVYIVGLPPESWRNPAGHVSNFPLLAETPQLKLPRRVVLLCARESRVLDQPPSFHGRCSGINGGTVRCDAPSCSDRNSESIFKKVFSMHSLSPRFAIFPAERADSNELDFKGCRDFRSKFRNTVIRR